MSIITEYPLWFSILCVFAGLAYAGALYFRDDFNKNYGAAIALLLGFFRFAAVTILAFLLLKPLIKTIDRTTEKPIIAICQDNSQSLVVGKDSSYYRGPYLAELQKLTDALDGEFEVRTFRFGDGVYDGIDSLNYSDPSTSFNEVFERISTNFSGRNLGAVIVASDGLYNKGSHPVYAFKKMNTSVFTLGLGDTTVYKDILIPDVSANRMAYLGNQFPMDIQVEAKKANGESATVTVTRKGNTLFSKSISFAGDHAFQSIPVMLQASEAGKQRYTVSVSRSTNEITYQNNTYDVFVDVIDSRQRILMLAYAPHPDLAAMRDAIESNESYKVDVALAHQFKGTLQDYDMVILHQLPAVGAAGAALVDDAVKRAIPTLFIWGSNTDYRAFNTLNTGFALNNYRNQSTDILGHGNKLFTPFTLDESWPDLMPQLPPLLVPFGDIQFGQGAQILSSQQVGQIKTNKPLISFLKTTEKKVGLIAGEGIWRWRIGAFQQYESHAMFDELITKIVQYLATKEDRSLFRVTTDNRFDENETIIFHAELYNDSYEPINQSEVGLVIRSEEGKEFNFAFSPQGDGYILRAGTLPPGNYSYTATAKTDRGNLTKSGEFSVVAIQLESSQTEANHQVMRQLAEENNGAFYTPNQMNELIEAIRNKKEIVSIQYEEKSLNDMIQLRWILFILIALLSMEWLLRKRSGTY
ncbi:MAG: hypothetical protein ACKOZY_00410 [Flavobacteriales bacterium]